MKAMVLWVIILLVVVAAGVQAAPAVVYVTEGSCAQDYPYPGFYGKDHLLVPQGEVTLVVGEGFIPGQTEVRWEGQAQLVSDKDFPEVFAHRQQGAAGANAMPSRSAKNAEIVNCTSQVLAFRAPQGGSYLAWVGSVTGGWSKPYLVNRAQAFWISQNPAPRGTIAFVFGRNLHPMVYPSTVTPHFAVRSKADGSWRAIPASAQWARKDYENNHAAFFFVPPDLPEGEYELYEHNGTGGDWGWSNAVPLTVGPTPQQRWPQTVFEAPKYGATGNDDSEDSAALQKALDAAGQAGGGIVYLPAGTYYLANGLAIPERVVLRGAGRDMTLLKVLKDQYGAKPLELPGRVYSDWYEGFIKTSPILYGKQRFTVEDLGIDGGMYHYDEIPKTGPAVLAFDGGKPCEDVTVQRCRIEHRTEIDNAPWLKYGETGSGAGIAAPQGSKNLKVIDCEIRARGCVWADYAEHALISNNRIEDFPGCVNHPFTLQGPHDCAILENILTHVGTGMHMTCTQNDADMVHNFIAWNTVELTRTAVGEDDGETQLMHPKDNYDVVATASGGTVDTVTFKLEDLTAQHAKWESGSLKGHWALVVGGKGLGQYRRVVGNTENSLTVAPAWEVVPDATSRVLTKVMVVENCFLRNSYRSCEGGTGYGAMDVANIVEGATFLNTGGLDLGASRSQKDNFRGKNVPMYCPAFFNDYNTNRVYEGGSLQLFCGVGMDWVPSVGITPRQNQTEYVMLGNTLRRNQIMQPSFVALWHLFPCWNWPWKVGKTGGAIGFSTTPVDDPKFKYQVFHWTVIEGNQLLQAEKGIAVGYRCADTILSNNRFEDVKVPVEDRGVGTIAR